MESGRHQPLDWKIWLGKYVVIALALMCFPINSLVCYIIWKCAPNPFLGVFVAWFFTLISMHLFSTISNIYGYLTMFLEPLLGTDLSTAFAGISFTIYKPLGKILHGYEIHGKENMPRTTGGLIVYQHTLVPYDLLYLMADCYVDEGKLLFGVVHRDMEMIHPGTCKVLNFTSNKDLVMERLKRGEVCSVSPGGAFEAVFSQNYELLWNGRTGFAEVAKKCGVPIIPMFTANGNAAMPVKVPFFRDFFKEVYHKTRRAFFLPLFLFPVKLRIYLGEPIFCGADESPAEFAKRAETAIYNLRDKYQHPETSILSAFLERFGYRLPSASDRHVC